MSSYVSSVPKHTDHAYNIETPNQSKKLSKMHASPAPSYITWGLIWDPQNKGDLHSKIKKFSERLLTDEGNCRYTCAHLLNVPKRKKGYW